MRLKKYRSFSKAIVLFLLFIPVIIGNTQAIVNKDSLLNLLSKAKQDTNKVLLLYTLSEQYDNSEPETAKRYIIQAGQLSKDLDYDAGTLRFYKRMMYVYAYLSKNDSALAYGNMILSHARQHNDTFNIGVALFNIGERYNYMSDYENGLKYTLEGVRILEGKGYPPRVEGAILGGLSITYLMMKNYTKSIEYGKKAEAIERKLDDKGPLIGTLINLANCYGEINDLNESEKIYKEAIALAKEYDNISYEIMIYQGLTDLSEKRNQVEYIKDYSEKGLALARQIDDAFGIMACSQGLSNYYLRVKNYNKGKELAFEALKIADENKFTEGKASVLQALSNLYFAEEDFNNAFKYQKEAATLLDNIFTESIAKKDAELRLKYETEKKESQIAVQKIQLRQKNILNYILIGSAAALLVILLLSYRNYLHKQNLQQQRITELETEKKLTATEAVLKGEEQERTRLAKDLHDGLGGMLSGIKYSFNSMKGNLVMTPENAQAFERSMDMLDSSIKEMRRVAHNMMPEALVKFGLDTALKDFCNDVNQSGALQVNYQSIGMTNAEIEQTTAITIYRIVQELINNTMKHAAAKTAIVQVSKEGKQIGITVEDDGKGFNPVILEAAKGIGWSNIQSRVEYLKGKLDVQSGAGKGTSIHIELTA